MRGICAKCRGTFDGQMLCPQCGLQLIDETEGSTVSFASVPLEDTADGPSVLRRLALGGVTVFGAFHGLQHLATTRSLSSGGGEFTRPEVPVVCLAVAALAAAVVAGTANRRAEATGLFLALCAAAAFLGADEIRHAPVADTWLTGIPVFLGLIGIVGGLVGRLAVPPVPKLPRFAQFGSRITPTVIREPQPRLAWGRVLAGATLVVAGTVNADAIRNGLSQVLAGRSGAFGAVQLMAWQLSVLAALAGGVLAGANTLRGIRQGAFAGLLAAVGTVIAVAATGPEHSRVMEFWVDQLGRNAFGLVPFAVLGGSVIMITAVGGWLGCQTFPPPRT